MKLVGDSGSTKTDWRLITEDGTISQYSCKGLNPHFHSSGSISAELKNMVEADYISSISEVYFYGSGTSTEANKKIVEEGIKTVFPNAKIEASHDLLGAARASAGKQAGLIGILGTGSNCCVYDGENITHSYRSGGYTLGDEGGGVDLGRRLLKAYVEEYLPKELSEAFDIRYKTTYDEILENLYKKEFPNRYMAGFAQFVYHHRNTAFIQDLILAAFHAYFNNQVLKLRRTDLPLNLVGSIAFYYHEQIKAVAATYGINIGTILEKPISGLGLYHLA